MPDFRTARFLGVDFALATYEQIAATVIELSKRDSFCYVVTPNVAHIIMLNPRQADATTERFRCAYRAAALHLCDSRVVQKLAAFRSIKLEVVTGSDLVALLFDQGYLIGRTVAIIGGDTSLTDDLNRLFPGVRVLQHRPPMGVLTNSQAIDRVVEYVATARADIVFFALGAPQSEIIAYLCSIDPRSRGVALCIGSSIDFLLGRKRRAPRWMRKLSLEWAFRLLGEPRRLWRRYIVIGPRIFLLAAQYGHERRFSRSGDPEPDELAEMPRQVELAERNSPDNSRSTSGR